MLTRVFELATAGVAGDWVSGVAALLLAASLVAYAVAMVRLWAVDVREHRLPNRLVYPLYATAGLPALTATALTGTGADIHRLLTCAVLMLGFYWIMRIASRRALGLGDVKLAGILGLLLALPSWANLLWGNLLIFLLGGLYSLILLITRRATASTHIAFGPFMLAGTALALIFPAS